MAPPTQPRRIVGISTKMYFSAVQTKNYISSVIALLSANPELTKAVDVFILPDHLTLASVAQQVQGTGILPGAQDAFYTDRGAFTGFASPAVMAELGCRIVALGHAERRRLLGETDDDAALKAAAVVRNGMVPLVCIGEHTQAGDGLYTAAVDECAPQVTAVMDAVPDGAEVVLAYEPVWAIGAAEPAGAEYVVSVVRGIRELECVRRRSGATRIVYGGSAGPGLWEKVKDGVDGLFLGRFAHEPARFVQTIREIAEV